MLVSYQPPEDKIQFSNKKSQITRKHRR